MQQAALVGRFISSNIFHLRFHHYCIFNVVSWLVFHTTVFQFIQERNAGQVRAAPGRKDD